MSEPVLNKEEAAAFNAMLRDAEEKLHAVRKIFEGTTRSYFLLGLVLSALNSECKFGTKGTDFAVARIKEWIIAGMPDNFSAEDIILALIKRSTEDI